MIIKYFDAYFVKKIQPNHTGKHDMMEVVIKYHDS